MNKFIILISFIFTFLLHLTIFYFYKTDNISNATSKNNNQMINIQLSKIENKEIKLEIPQTKEALKETKKENFIKKETINPTKKVLQNKIEEKVEKKIEESTPNSTNISTIPQKQSENTIATERNGENKKQDFINEEKFILEYGKKVRQTINENKTYPNVSKKLKEEGLVIISFKVLKNGKIENLHIKQSSNKERLDNAAINALNETNSFEVFDENIKKEFLDFEIALEFSIK